MSMSTYVMGIWPPDDRFKEMLNVYRACEEAGVTIPTEVETFFNDDVPNESGVVTQLKLEDDAVNPWQGDDASGLEVDLRKLPADVKTIRFVNSW